MSVDDAIRQVVSEHAIAAALREARLEAIAQGDGWSADLDAGTLTLGDQIFAAELLGTQSEADGTFLWGWDHPSAPAGRDTLARRVYEQADQRGIDALRQANPPTEVVDAMTAAVLGIGLADGDAWWLAPSGPTTVVLLVRDEQLAAAPYSLLAFPRLLMELNEALSFDARTALDAFTAAPLPGFTATPDGDRALVVQADGGSARIELDGQDRIARITLELESVSTTDASAAKPRGFNRLFRRR